MNKIGILTIFDENMGNRLQNFAMQEILNDYGDASTIKRTYSCDNTKLSFSRKIKKIRACYFSLPVIREKIVRLKYKKHVSERHKRFEEFNSKINFSCFLTKKTNYNNLNSQYDYFIVGSDQIWNPDLFDNMWINMLAFADNNKKIAIAPSIAKVELSKEQAKEFSNYLQFFKYLSCREQDGANLIQKITNRNCDLFMDPTLFLTEYERRRIEKKPEWLFDESKKYALVYFLGNYSKEALTMIDYLKNILNVAIIDINNIKSNTYETGPSEFLYLIDKASIILTDSFHATIFSFIFDKNIKVFARKGSGGKMVGRIESLSKILDIDTNIFDIYTMPNLDTEAKYSKEKLNCLKKELMLKLKALFSENI